MAFGEEEAVVVDYLLRTTQIVVVEDLGCWPAVRKARRSYSAVEVELSLAAWVWVV